MILSLNIKNFAIIEDINISFNNGMNILLGETGAGKSIIIDAIGLLMGNRSDFDKIRNGETKALVEGTFQITNKVIKDEINEKYNLIEEDDIIVVSRTLENGKSICRLNYRIVPQSVLKDVMEGIIDIHSQHKNNSFFLDKKQIEYVDLYLNKNKEFESYKINELFSSYEEQYTNYLDAKRKYQELLDKQNELEDRDYLEFQIAEIEKCDIKENEIEDIEEELVRLNSFEKIFTYFKSFEENFNNASSYLYQSKKDLSHINDDSFSSEIEKFNSLYYELEDNFENIKSLFSSLEDSNNRIEYLNNRKLQLSPLRRKYGRSTSEILSYLNQAKESLDLIDNFDDVLSKQEKLINDYYTKSVEIAENISKLRLKAAKKLEDDMNNKFNSLALSNAKFKVQFNRCEICKNGVDQILFLIQANAGSKFLSLSQSASLGETSRINLAYKLVFNKLNPVETIIFDEIDTGISSKVGVLVSKKIKELSSLTQTIVISHLPQMVAIGDYAYFVSKETSDYKTKTNIKLLNDSEIMEEVAKMISGSECNNISYDAAKELIASMKK